ncbi:hypothetical protein ABZ646_17245 [Streptomyces sp. NPDC007162]|uniref:hypothetical protein n=1 Tax=Streptomyces sp. NPDC007162 TaxID=3156917 RepID=UPI003401AF59
MEALAPKLDEEMQSLAAVVLDHIAKALDEQRPRPDAATRLHELGVAVRAALAWLKLVEERVPGDPPAHDPGGWLMII